MKKLISVILAAVTLCAAMPVLPAALSAGIFTYRAENSSAVITGYTGSSANVTVPSQIAGLNVSAVESRAFYGKTSITSITVSQGVEAIGDSAFENCVSLASVKLPSTIKSVGENAFLNTKIYNDKSNAEYWKQHPDSSGSIDTGSSDQTGAEVAWEDIVGGNLDYLYVDGVLVFCTFEREYSVKPGTLVIADGALKGCAKAQKINLCSSLAAVGDSAFYGCSSLKSVKIPESVEKIGASAFQNCTSLAEIQLPEKAVEIGENAFLNTAVYNSAQNKDEGFYIDGHLIESGCDFETVVADGTKYIDSGALGTVSAVIPDSVTDISPEAFDSHENVTIFGFGGSFAEKYARENAIAFVDIDLIERGDINFDGETNSADYAMLCSVSQADSRLPYAARQAGDIDGDGAVDAFDAIVLDLMLHSMGPSEIKGDIDGDTKLTYDDYLLLVKIVNAGYRISDSFMLKRCDLTGDGAVDAFDAIALDLMLINS